MFNEAIKLNLKYPSAYINKGAFIIHIKGISLDIL